MNIRQFTDGGTSRVVFLRNVSRERNHVSKQSNKLRYREACYVYGYAAALDDGHSKSGRLASTYETKAIPSTNSSTLRERKKMEYKGVEQERKDRRVCSV
ncbi:hypothetical protein ISCGN_018920 [Ixodes scapularis]|uniref:Uncharacterized protein n=1 Tax=Ixodes scapularis TaxID=6945 RepID=B7QIP1_IXOSC|nr:hypothetical protein IscW_ISCW014287 [Ixodes scapularis]|eukprot:XP_002415049.1 hypothetical protein IscW_ISCW014287 [Ixodes scapularis]